MSKLTLAQANKIVETALAKAREMKIKPLAVAVLDESGHVKSLPREDGTTLQPSSFSFEVRFPGLAAAASPLDKRVEHDRDRRSCW
ncbi:MAG TPA: heme-binding protein, partial [Reyranella sp.]|nr:heme-binding protein [Reyranella sp.]